MAAIADRLPGSMGRDNGFFLGGAIAMTLVLVAGFSVQLGMGRSSFSAPLLVHAHAVVFMGWVGIYLLQNVFAATGRQGLHRRLGWIAAVWIIPMLVLGCAVMIAIARRGQVPFFFTPLQFLVFDPLSLFTFAGLTVAAILLGPGVGRLLPMPLLAPWAWEATILVCLLFPLAGMLADLRREGRVHAAWGWGVGTLVGFVLLTEAITFSPVGTAFYRAVVAGSPGAGVAPLAFPPPPAGPQITGRPAG